jgi:hypothetical protein
MIGVISRPEEREPIEEFFQLFKTPWEFYDPGRGRYDVLIATHGIIPATQAALIVMYGAERCALDVGEQSGSELRVPNLFVEWGDLRVPIYRKALTFSNVERPIILCSQSAKPMGYEIRKGEQRILRIGYDLFEEVSFLLTKGQPVENAMIPTLDQHIAMLRSWIIETGIELSEIPPVPEGYEFITCLTHDVDFIDIRRHFLDHSMWGFLYRATLGSLVDVIRNRASVAKLLENAKAALSLPFVLLGICPDPWDQFEHYLEIEGGAPSTFFFIPYKNHAGEGFDKKNNKYRAARYDVKDVRDTINKLLTHGCEAGVHGIDAWLSVEFGKNEINRLRAVTGREKIGIRMHWLCWNESTFSVLDQAGYHYDSTFGYNDSVGFKAGTAQVHKPLGVKHLLELPLHIQDTALFSPGRMHLTSGQATLLCDEIIEDVDRYKGVLTLLWHQRSLGPERLWGEFYQMLLKKLRERNTWFAAAGDVVDWFRIRRLARFLPTGEIDVSCQEKEQARLPKLALRKYTS